MKSRASFCNRTLLKTNLRRFWLLPALTAVVFVLTLSLLTRRLSFFYLDNPQEWARGILEENTQLGILMLLPVSFLAAMFPFSYLHKRNSAYMFHALPFSREGLFCTECLSGLLFGLLPIAALTLVNLLSVVFSAEIPLSAVAGTLWLSALAMTLAFLLLYGLAVFSMQLTGKIFAAIGVYLLLNFGVVAGELLCKLILSPYLYGIDVKGLHLSAFSPLVKLLFGYADSLPENIWLLGIYAGVGILFTAFSFLLYRKRRIETAGDPVAYKSAAFVLKYIVTFIVGAAIGILLAVLFGVGERNAGVAVAVCVLFGGAVAFILSEMILNRTVKVFRPKLLLGYLGFAALFCLMLLCAKLDIFGVVRYVPDVSEVKSVEINAGGAAATVLTEPEDISALLPVHRQLTENRRGNIETSLTLTYTLKSGRTVSRNYEWNDYDLNIGELSAVLNRADRLEQDFLAKTKNTGYYSCNGVDLDGEALREAYFADAENGNIQYSNLLFTDRFVGSAYYFIVDCIDANWDSRTAILIPETAAQTTAYLEQAGVEAYWKEYPED